MGKDSIRNLGVSSDRAGMSVFEATWLESQYLKLWGWNLGISSYGAGIPARQSTGWNLSQATGWNLNISSYRAAMAGICV